MSMVGRDVMGAAAVAISPIAGVVLAGLLGVGSSDLASYPLFAVAVLGSVFGAMLGVTKLERRC